MAFSICDFFRCCVKHGNGLSVTTQTCHNLRNEKDRNACVSVSVQDTRTSVHNVKAKHNIEWTHILFIHQTLD